MWRNWQTRRLQVPVSFRTWRFESSHPHSQSPLYTIGVRKKSSDMIRRMRNGVTFSVQGVYTRWQWF